LGKIEQALSPKAGSIGESMRSGQIKAVSDQGQGPLDSQQRSFPAAHEVEVSSTYNQLLHPWCVVQLLPDMQRRTVARFRRRNDADAQLKAMRRLSPSAQYTVMFNPSTSVPSFAPEEHREVFA